MGVNDFTWTSRSSWAAWMLGSTPPCVMVTPSSSLFNPSCPRTGTAGRLFGGCPSVATGEDPAEETEHPAHSGSRVGFNSSKAPTLPMLKVSLTTPTAGGGVIWPSQYQTVDPSEAEKVKKQRQRPLLV